MNQAWELLFEGKIDEAKQLVQAEFSLATCKDYSLLNLMGYIYLYEKKYEDCLEIYQRYLHLAITEKDRENEHIAYHQLAMVYREMNDFQTALSYIEKEREVIEQDFSGDYLKYSVNDYEQGYLRLKLGQLVEAEFYMQQSLDLALKTDDLIAQACAYRGLGEIYRKLDSSKSYDYFSHVIKLFDKAGDEIGAEEVRALIDNKKSETKQFSDTQKLEVPNCGTLAFFCRYYNNFLIMAQDSDKMDLVLARIKETGKLSINFFLKN